MPFVPLDLEKIRLSVTLPKSWQQLERSGFHPDLLDRAYAHLAWTDRHANERWTNNARAFLSSVGRGFYIPFDRSRYEPKSGDPYFDLKTHALDAITELSQEFNDRVSSVMWDALAHLSTREEPEENRSILKEAGSLPHHFGVVDTMLHAAGKVYTFLLRVQSVFFRHTGMVLIHNCDCNCSLVNLRATSGAISFELSPNGRHEATQSLLTHMLAESHLILNGHLPFEYTITEEGLLLFG